MIYLGIHIKGHDLTGDIWKRTWHSSWCGRYNSTIRIFVRHGLYTWGYLWFDLTVNVTGRDLETRRTLSAWRCQDYNLNGNIDMSKNTRCNWGHIWGNYIIRYITVYSRRLVYLGNIACLSKSHLLRHQGHRNADDIMLIGVHVVSCQHICD